MVAAILIALVAGAVFTSPPLQTLQGLSLDILTALRGKLVGDRRDPATSPVVVVAIDGETYDTPPFKGSPTQTWTREIGRVLGSITDGGAKVIGFDVIFPSSIEQSEIPFGDAPLGGRMKGFDRDYLIALRKLSDSGKLVLGEKLSNDHPEGPDRSTATGGEKQCPRPQRLHRSRRCDPTDAAELLHRRQAGSCDGRRARRACARCTARDHAVRRHRTIRLCHPERGPQHADAQFPRDGPRRAGLFLRRPARLRREGRSRFLPPCLRRQGRAARQHPHLRRPQAHFDAPVRRI